MTDALRLHKRVQRLEGFCWAYPCLTIYWRVAYSRLLNPLRRKYVRNMIGRSHNTLERTRYPYLSSLDSIIGCFLLSQGQLKMERRHIWIR